MLCPLSTPKTLLTISVGTPVCVSLNRIPSKGGSNYRAMTEKGSVYSSSETVAKQDVILTLVLEK